MRRTANFSPCRTYRYALRRTWDAEKRTVLFIGLNPSTADECTDDATIRRCIGFAQAWGHGRLIMANLFAYRSTDPAALLKVADPVGAENDAWLRRLVQEADLTIVAWGIHGTLLQRHEHVLRMLPKVHCLGVTIAGHPKHPLYLPGGTAPVCFAA